MEPKQGFHPKEEKNQSLQNKFGRAGRKRIKLVSVCPVPSKNRYF
jgi:hypothetical protein